MNSNYLNILSKAKNPLVIAVGGGNDSVSTLLIQKQLQKTFGYNPDKITIVAMLPDCLEYVNTEETSNPLVTIITENTQRYVQGKLMNAFPERILSQNKNAINSLNVIQVYGLLMSKGSIGVASSLQYLITQEKYDLILAMDVGGDFIAVPENIEVLSPMMDAYMMYAFKYLKQNSKEFRDIPIIYGVFGLGTDGETTPELLDKALENLNAYEGTFNEEDVKDVINFYRETVEPNRYSRTTDFTIREIQGFEHDNPAQFRGRFHVQTNNDEKSNVNYGTFEHYQDKKYFSKYYLFTNIDAVSNPFAISCNNGLEWFVNIQSQKNKINHELNGQSYNLKNIISFIEKDIFLFFGTPSRKFNTIQQEEIAEQISLAVQNNIYDLVLVYEEQLPHFDGLIYEKVGNELLLVGKDLQLIRKIAFVIENYLA